MKELYAHLEPTDAAICSVVEGVWVSTITAVKKMRVFSTTKVQSHIVISSVGLVAVFCNKYRIRLRTTERTRTRPTLAHTPHMVQITRS